MNLPSDTQDTTKKPEKRRALGRGLEVLLPRRASTENVPEDAHQPGGSPLEVPLDKIDRNPFQTRTTFDEAKLAELAQSIAASGVVQPIVVRAIQDGRYQLITGERRLRAARQAGLSKIPAIVRTVSDEQAMEMTIVENLQRADLNPIEQARAYHRLSTDFHMTQEKMAVRTGKERATVSNFLRLLKLPVPVQHQVETGELSFGHARTLLSLPSAEAIVAAAGKVTALSLSVRQTETYVNGLLNPESKSGKQAKVINPQDANVVEAQQILQRTLGLKVKIEDKHGKGRVIIEYSGLEDFDLLMSALDHKHNA